MPSSTSTLLARLSTKLHPLFRLGTLLSKRKPSTASDHLPITRSPYPSFHHSRGRKLTRDSSEVLYAQAHWDVEAAPALAVDSSSDGEDEVHEEGEEDEVWSWEDQDEREFSVTRRTPQTSNTTDLSGGQPTREATRGDEWKEEWKEISMCLREGAMRRVVITTVDNREDLEKHDSGYCEYDYAQALRALQEPRTERGDAGLGYLDRVAREFGKERCMAASKARFGAMVRSLRQEALAVDGDEEEEMMVHSRDTGSMKTRDGEVAGGDVWWRV
jgi:hypothetical protein